MDSAPAAQAEFEVLDRVGDVDQPPVDAGLFQRVVQHLSRWANEWPADDVFLIARLFPNEHYACSAGPLAEYGLCGGAVQLAAFAAARLVRDTGDRAGFAGRQHDKAQWRTIQRARHFIERFRFRQSAAIVRGGENEVAMRLPPGAQRVVVARIFQSATE